MAAYDLCLSLDLVVQRQPDKPALIFHSSLSASWTTINYQQLLDKSNRFARRLEAIRVKPGARATVAFPLVIGFFLSVFFQNKIRPAIFHGRTGSTHNPMHDLETVSKTASNG